MGQKRQREDGNTADASASEKQPGSGGKATLGQQTSHIKNKLVRAELYAKLKHKQKVSALVYYGTCKDSVEAGAGVAALSLHAALAASVQAAYHSCKGGVIIRTGFAVAASM
jgi:hypothetical protein